MDTEDNPTWDPAPSRWALQHARESRAGERLPRGHAEVTLVTDPWSVWCWGFEPVRRTIELRYPTLKFQLLVGGMFERLPDPDAMGFDIERFFATVQRTTGMPIRHDATRRDRPDSTYPACVHAHALALVEPALEASYMRRLREAVYLDGLNVSRPEVAADVAENLGVPREDFLEALESGEPEREFRSALSRLQERGITGYPTILVRAGERLARVPGFQSLPALLAIVERVSGTEHEPGQDPGPLDCVPPGERVATREAAEAMGMSVERAHDTLRELADEGLVGSEQHPTGYVWYRA